MDTLRRLPDSLPELYDPSLSVKLVGVAQKYDLPQGQPILRNPEYTRPGGPNSYHCSTNSKAWTQGFFPGALYLLAERLRLLPSSLDRAIADEQTLLKYARRYCSDWEYLKRPSINHDQGFRFQLTAGKDLELTGSEHHKAVLLDAADSLVDRFHEGAGCIRSWDSIKERPEYGPDRMDQHYLVIIDNMMNLDMLYEATALTGNQNYARIANIQAEKSMKMHIRPDWTTYHVVNVNQQTGEVIERMTHQGWADDSIWSRGQAWGIYGYVQCALRTGRRDFLDVSRKLADVFLEHLPASGVPWWDFKAPNPPTPPYDASAGMIAARGMQMLYVLLQQDDPTAAEIYLERAFKLVKDTIRECITPPATFKGNQAAEVDFGEGGWETLLMHSSIAGNPKIEYKMLDHGLVYADYYFIEFGNEALKLQQTSAKKQ